MDDGVDAAMETPTTTMAATAKATPAGGSLLATLRQNNELIQKGMLRHRSEFPAKIREAIDLHKDENPADFCRKIRGLLKSMLLWRPPAEEEQERPKKRARTTTTDEAETTTAESSWGGFDIDVDTLEEFEISIRMFPSLLTEGFECDQWRREGDCVGMPIDMVWSPKIIPFLPVFARVGKDILAESSIEHITFVHVVANFVGELVVDDVSEDDEWRQQLNETALHALNCIKNLHLLEEEPISDAVHRIVESNMCYNAERLRFLIDWHPESLLCENGSLIRTFLVNVELVDTNEVCYVPQHTAMNAFRLFFETGMIHFPVDMGFFFKRGYVFMNNTDYNDIFSMTCDVYSSETIVGMVNNVLEKVLEDPETYRFALVGAISDKNILLDALYLLIRYDPCSFCHENMPRWLCNNVFDS